MQDSWVPGTSLPACRACRRNGRIHAEERVAAAAHEREGEGHEGEEHFHAAHRRLPRRRHSHACSHGRASHRKIYRDEHLDAERNGEYAGEDAEDERCAAYHLEDADEGAHPCRKPMPANMFMVRLIFSTLPRPCVKKTKPTSRRISRMPSDRNTRIGLRCSGMFS